MERYIQLTHRPYDYESYWLDRLTKDGREVQKIEFKLEEPILVNIYNDTGFFMHSSIKGEPFYIIIEPGLNKLTYNFSNNQQMLMTSIINYPLTKHLNEYFTSIMNGENGLGDFEFNDRPLPENEGEVQDPQFQQDPHAENQNHRPGNRQNDPALQGGKKRRKTRRHRRS